MTDGSVRSACRENGKAAVHNKTGTGGLIPGGFVCGASRSP